MTPDIQGRLGRLRQLLHGSPSASAWESVLTVLRTWPDKRDVEIGIDYALGHLDDWPDVLRHAEPAWVRATLRGEPPVVWPLVRTVTTLGGMPGPVGVEALADSPHMGQITRLGLASYGLDDVAAEQLGASPHLGSLTHLNLQRNRVTAAGLRRLIGPASQLPERVVLDLRHNPLDLASLGDLPDPSPRVVVVAASARIHAYDLPSLARTLDNPFMRPIHTLSVASCPLGDGLLTVLQSAPHLDHLRMLDLERCALGERSFDTTIAALLGQHELNALNLRHNLLTPTALRYLNELPQLSALHTLDLSGNSIGDEGLRPLFANPHLTTLRTLRLSDCWLTPASARLLAEATWLSELRHLDLAQNDLDDSVTLLLDAPHLANTWLNVSVRRYAHPALAERVADHNANLEPPTLAVWKPWQGDRQVGGGQWWGEGALRQVR